MGNQTEGHQGSRVQAELILPAAETERPVFFHPALIM